MSWRDLVGAFATTVLALVALLHVGWASGATNWPAPSRDSLADTVVGPGAKLPSAGLTVLVSALIGAAGAVLAGRLGWWGRRLPTWVFRWGAVTVAAVLLLRGLAGVVTSARARPRQRYHQLDLAAYSPLCIALGLAAAAITSESS